MQMYIATINADLIIAACSTWFILLCCFFVGDACFLPVAMLARDLREEVVHRLSERHPDDPDYAGINIPTVN